MFSDGRARIAGVLVRPPTHLVLDLSEVSFLDSTGVHGLLPAQHNCAEAGVRLALIPGPGAVQHVLEICGPLEILPFVAGDEALAGPETR